MRRLNLLARLAFAALIALVVMPAVGAPLGGTTLMAYSVLTNSDVDKIWRKSQGKLQKGFNFVTPEFKWVRQFKELEIDASLREMTYPIDLYEDRGITMLPEGGREAEPMSQNAEDATVAFVHANGRFTVAKIARWATQADAGRGAIEKQLKFQGMKKVQAMGRVLGDQFYGYSTGYLAQCDGGQGGATSHTITLKNAYGDSDIAGSTTAEAAYIANLFKVGDRVALIQGGSLVSNSAGGEITAISASTPSITVSWNASVTITDNDYVVLSNGASATTIAHTSYNRHLVGLLDFLKSTSVHGISSSSVDNWDVAHSDTAAGRFTGQKYQKAVDEIQNYGDENENVITLMAQGVARDVTAQYQAGVRYSSPMGMAIDGDFTAGGNKPRKSRRVPPGMVAVFGKSAIRKKTIFDNADSAPSWGSGKELIDDSGWIFAIDWSGFLCTGNRKLFAYFQNQTEI